MTKARVCAQERLEIGLGIVEDCCDLTLVPSKRKGTGVSLLSYSAAKLFTLFVSQHGIDALVCFQTVFEHLFA